MLLFDFLKRHTFVSINDLVLTKTANEMILTIADAEGECVDDSLIV